MEAASLEAATQLFYVKLAIKRGNWSDLGRHDMEPTPTMKLLFMKGRERYVGWRKRRDEEEAAEDAAPKSWFEISPGHWVWAKDEESAKNLVQKFDSASLGTRREIFYPEIDTSKTCPQCKLRRKEPERSVCGNCISMGYET